jgi:hypothetical protein
VIAALGIIAAAWIVVAALGTSGYSFAAGCFKRHSTYVNVTLWQPPLPHPSDDDGWDEWLSAWPADAPIEDIEQAVYDRLFAEMPEVADDLRWLA